MSWLTQIGAVVLVNLRTIPQRLGSSAVAVLGIAGVVIVFVAVLSMAEGFLAVMTSAGSPNRVLVMRSGADDEMTSVLSGPTTDIIKQAPGIAREGSGPLASDELFVVVGGGLGLALAWGIVQRGDPTGGLLSPFVLPSRDVIAGIGLMAVVGVASGLLPATGAMRIKITDALRKA